VLRWLAIALAVVLVAGASTALYLWRQATSLPAWADDEADPGMDALAPAEPHGSTTPGWIEVGEELDEEVAEENVPDVGPPAPSRARPNAAPKKRVDHRRRELRDFHLRAAAKNVVAAKAIRRSRAIYEDGVLEAGVVVELSRIPRDELRAEDRRLLDRAFSAFPFLRDRAVYVGIEDEPTSRNGFLQLGRKTRVRVGKLEYSLAALARKLGVDARRVRAQLDRELRRLKVTDPGD
jgi:hypothetical protein